MRRMLFEKKIMGLNVLLIFVLLTFALSILAYFGGELLNSIGFEVIFPFMTAIAVGEWGKIRSDANFELIAAQSNSIFKWVAVRFWTIFLTGTMFSFISMMLVFLIRYEITMWEMVLLYIPPAFFLSTLCALCGIIFSREHIATMISGILWILSMLARSLLRIPGVEYIYLFIRYAGDVNGVWLINKIVLTLLGFVLWIIIYQLCKSRILIK